MNYFNCKKIVDDFIKGKGLAFASGTNPRFIKSPSEITNEDDFVISIPNWCSDSIRDIIQQAKLSFNNKIYIVYEVSGVKYATFIKGQNIICYDENGRDVIHHSSKSLPPYFMVIKQIIEHQKELTFRFKSYKNTKNIEKLC